MQPTNATESNPSTSAIASGTVASRARLVAKSEPHSNRLVLAAIHLGQAVLLLRREASDQIARCHAVRLRAIAQALDGVIQPLEFFATSLKEAKK